MTDTDLDIETVEAIQLAMMHATGPGKRGQSLAFSPWHALEAHRPVGEVNEVRKAVYLASQQLRHNG